MLQCNIFFCKKLKKKIKFKLQNNKKGNNFQEITSLSKQEFEEMSTKKFCFFLTFLFDFLRNLIF